jgi:hypothetical protein
MKLSLGAWYNEPGISFAFSHKISNYIHSVIKESIMEPLGLLEQYPDLFLHLTICTKLDQKKLEVKMGDLKKNTKDINCGIWFPYNKIILASNPKEAYVECYIEALLPVFIKWNVTNSQIKQAGDKIRNEIYDNPKYDFTKEELEAKKKEKDGYDKVLTDILKDMNLD